MTKDKSYQDYLRKIDKSIRSKLGDKTGILDIPFYDYELLYLSGISPSIAGDIAINQFYLIPKERLFKDG